VEASRPRGEALCADVWHVAKELATFDATFAHPTAVITSPAHFDLAKFFELASQNRGFHVRAFDGFESAIDWLFEEVGEAPA
jgi:hypothetical protein